MQLSLRTLGVIKTSQLTWRHVLYRCDSAAAVIKPPKKTSLSDKEQWVSAINIGDKAGHTGWVYKICVGADISFEACQTLHGSTNAFCIISSSGRFGRSISHIERLKFSYASSLWSNAGIRRHNTRACVRLGDHSREVSPRGIGGRLTDVIAMEVPTSLWRWLVRRRARDGAPSSRKRGVRTHQKNVGVFVRTSLWHSLRHETSTCWHRYQEAVWSLQRWVIGGQVLRLKTKDFTCMHVPLLWPC